MKASDVRLAITRKRLDFDIASEEGRHHEELNKIYQEIKTLQYRLLELEMAEKGENLLSSTERF